MQSSSPARESRSGQKAGRGRGWWVKWGSGCSRGQSTFSHLYSPKVQSSSFIGWNSGSVCASSFSLTSEGTGSNLDKPANTGEKQPGRCIVRCTIIVFKFYIIPHYSDWMWQKAPAEYWWKFALFLVITRNFSPYNKLCFLSLQHVLLYMYQIYDFIFFKLIFEKYRRKKTC